MKQIIEIVLILAALATTTVEAAYIKVDAAGNALADSAAEWSCVYDDVNQLLWEVKTDDGGIHDKDNRYRWGGAAESGLAGDNFGEWDTLTDGSNLSTLCSHYDWRVPTDTELSKVVTTGQGSPTINTAFFPNTPTDWGWFWSSTPYPNVTSSAWVLRLDTGSVSGDSRSSSNHVRLVRSGSLDHILHLDQFEGTEGYSVLDAVTATASGNCEGGCNKSVSFSGQLDIAQQEVLHGFVVQLEEFDHIGVISSVALYFDPRYNVKFGESGSIDSVVTGKSIGAYATVSSPFSSSAEQNVHSVMQGLVAGAAQSLTGAYVSIANTGITLDTYFKFKIIAFGEPPPNQAPSASFSVDESSLLIDTNIPIDASASTDPDGTISSYQWSTSDGQSASGITQNISFSTPGTYTITLTVTDNDGATATTSQSVTVTSQPPVAAFSIERLTGSTTDTNSFQLDSNGLMTLQLDGSTSNDPDGSIASWLWDTSGTATGTQSLSGQNAVLTVTAPGTATITLTVTDNHGVTATTSQTITVSELENQAPTASFIAMPLSGSAPLLVALDASSSTDSDGSIASYSWSSSDGQSATSSTASFSFSEVGSYIITLTITDDDGDTGSESQTVTVQENQSPTVTISVSPTSGEVPLVVSFDGTASSDSDGSIASYSWLTSDEQSATGSTTSFTFAAAGSYTVTLTVTDNSGLTSSTTTTVTATEVQPPVAIFTATPIIGQAPLTVTVDGTASTTPNDSIIAYQWSSSDGQSASGSTASFTFGEVGTYTITHTVVDSSAQTATSTQDITVTDALTAVIIATPMTGSAPLSVTLDGSGSSTPNSSIIAYNWSSSDGQEGIGSSASFTYDNAGEYTVTLTVIDSEATTATTTETITVEEEAVLGYNPTARLSPQVIAGGISPSQIDLNDTALDIVAIVRPGVLPVDRVTFQSSDNSFALQMNSAGVLQNGDEVHRITYNFSRGAFGTTVFPTFWGAEPSMFNIIAYDAGEVRSHQFPYLFFGNFPTQTATVQTASPISYLTTKRRGPQVILGGLSPSKIDLNDTNFDVIAVIRGGVLPIEQVSVAAVEGSFGMEMSEAGALENGDLVYKITYTFGRGSFPPGTVLNSLWGDRFGQFNIIAVDEGQQRAHHFPDIMFGNFPAQ